jgi:hypothetical protein
MSQLLHTKLAEIQAKLRAVRDGIAGQQGGLVSINELALTCTVAEAIAYRNSLQVQADTLDGLLSDSPHFRGV